MWDTYTICFYSHWYQIKTLLLVVMDYLDKGKWVKIIKTFSLMVSL